MLFCSLWTWQFLYIQCSCQSNHELGNKFDLVNFTPNFIGKLTHWLLCGPWPLFLFWRHHFWAKLASYILNICRRKRSFQWCPDQNDRPMEPEIPVCAKMLKKLSEKLRAKFLATTPGYTMVKIAHLSDAFLEGFTTASKPSRRPITTAKRKEKEKKERQNFFFKNQKA